MIYNRDESEVVTLGEIEKHSVSIDAKNINHIVTILSSNLYSYPMISFLRETVSNAVDSHVEAEVDEPIIITRTKDDISIRDFGTGISPERFETIYLNIGSSTKRESNDYIGSFGIGRFSCLSVSKLANITSFYNGKAYYYVMNMDIDQLHIDKIYELDTVEHNGVEVKIPIRDFDGKTLDCLGFIENIYVECDGDNDNSYIISEFNKRKINTYNNFKTISYEHRTGSDKTEVLLGKIPYAVDYLGLWDYTDSWHRSWEKTMKCIYPCIKIGEIDITPNREQLIYSDRTKERLRKAYDDCIAELTELWNQYCDTEYDDFFTWASELTAWRTNKLPLDGIDITISDQLPFNAKYKNYPSWSKIDPKQKKNIVQTLMNYSLETLGTFEGGTIYKGRKDTVTSIKRLFNDWLHDVWKKNRMVLVVPAQNGFSGKYFKDFLGYKYPGKNIMFLRRKKVTHHEMKSFIRTMYGITMLTDTVNLPFVVELLSECYRTIRSGSTYNDIINSAEYQQYKKEHQSPKTYITRHTGKINFTIINTEWYNTEKRNMTIDELMKYLKSEFKKKRVVYSTLDSPFLSAFHKIAYPNLIILSAAKNNMKYLEEGLPEWIVPIENLYTKDNKILAKYKTTLTMQVRELRDFGYDYYPVMPHWVQDRLSKLRQFMTKYDIHRKNNNYYDTDAVNLLDILPEDANDPFMIAELRELRPYLELSYKISHSLSIYGGNPELEYYLLMKAKKLRPCYEYYKKIRERVTGILNAL